jgi:hypothetical protein
MKIEKLNQHEAYIIVKRRNGDKHRVFFNLSDARKVKGRAWHVSQKGYCRTYVGTRTPGMPEILFGKRCDHYWMYDHVNHHKLDNRRSNLRYCTVTENLLNRPGITSNTGYTGVTYGGGYYRVRDRITGEHRACKDFGEAIIYSLINYLDSFADFDRAVAALGLEVESEQRAEEFKLMALVLHRDQVRELALDVQE